MLGVKQAGATSWKTNLGLVPQEGDVPLYEGKEWVGLTDEEVIEWVESGEYNVITNDWASHIEFAKAIEAKLKEKNK